jgi:predicted SnoaL-like aldol condensation-catalyzing enzyme
MEPDPAAVVDRYWHRVWNEGDTATVDEVFTDPYVRHSQNGNAIRGHEQVRSDVAQYRRALRDVQVSVDDRVTSGDLVWNRLTLRAVNVETAEAVVFSWLYVARVVDGRIAESWQLNAANVDWTRPPERSR